MPNGEGEADRAGAVQEAATVGAGTVAAVLAVAGVVGVMRVLVGGMAVDVVTPTQGVAGAGATMVAAGTAEGEATTAAIIVLGTTAAGGLALRWALA